MGARIIPEYGKIVKQSNPRMEIKPCIVQGFISMRFILLKFIDYESGLDIFQIIFVSKRI